jgi:type II secretory pathway pseudopilin PulG
MENNLIQLGAIGILFAIAIREFFGYLKKRNSNREDDHYFRAILQELKAMNENHFHSLEKAIKEGNDRLIIEIHADNSRMIELLGRIEGKLGK